MAMCTSSLLERRGRSGLTAAPVLRPIVPQKDFSGDVVEAFSDCTTAPSASASPSTSPSISPSPIRLSGLKDLEPLRRHRLKQRPSINCELVLQDQQSFSDPFSHAQCSRLNEEYEGFHKLGEGSCGVVYKSRSRADNKDVALKVMRMDDEERLNIAQKEYELLKHVSHPNIIRALDFFTYSMGAVLVLDYFDGRRLDRAVKEAPGCHLSESSARRLYTQLLGAVAHLHMCGVIHRDIKADNILVSTDLCDLRLVDFNAAKRLAESQSLTMTGTVDYMPPEVLQGTSPSEAGDIWAIGLCLYLMLDGRLPSERRALRIKFDSLDEVPLWRGSLVRLEGEMWETISEPCKQVVWECLKVNNDMRPTASSLLKMSWLTSCGCENGITPSV